MQKKIFKFLKYIWKSIGKDDKRGEPPKPPHRLAPDVSIQRLSHTNRIQNLEDKKKFTIKQTERKTFSVKGTTDTSQQTSSSRESSTKLKGITKTRPKICPVCHTKNKITLTTEKKWKCKACEHEW